MKLRSHRFAAAALLLAAFPVRADDLSAWLAARQARFAAFHAAHPRPDAEIARIKVHRDKAAAHRSAADALFGKPST